MCKWKRNSSSISILNYKLHRTVELSKPEETHPKTENLI